MKPKAINLAYIGSGGWARKHHFPALDYIRSQDGNPYAIKLRGITSLENEVAQAVAAQYGFESVYPDVPTLLADEKVDAVAVAVNPESAKQVLSQVAKRKIPIFSEKPPGISTMEAQELGQLIDVPNVLAFNRRFIPLNQKFKQIVGEMDPITFMEGSFYRHARLDETFMIGTGIHWINFIEFIFGEIQHVQTERWKNPENESWLRIAKLIFVSGLRGMIKVFPCTGSEYERMTVHSHNQSIYLDGPMAGQPGEIIIDHGNERTVIEQPTPLPPDIVRLGIVGEYQAFFDL
ncbi:MAG: Gfo/Idh/MocA family oxidoreductase, partial [Anaerolineae bacterium]|nr:Gfo/Idh/MocA family oxidoreductase [Anaerolineae bacterium]